MTQRDEIQGAATSGDFEATVRIHASSDVVFDALTTTEGLAGWWAMATGVAVAGGELRFQMNNPQPLVMRVDRADRPTGVQWTVADCPWLPDWNGTRPTFAIRPDGDDSVLEFRHVGLTAKLDCIEMCTRGWNFFLGHSLPDYAETGKGSPVGSDADSARHAAQGAANGA